MSKSEELTVERSYPSGAWQVSALISDAESGDYYRRELYMGYTKREAIALYLEEWGSRIVTD